jgi:hypothetical protein
MPSWIDGTLYPDTEIPEDIHSLEARIDFLSRLCSAWDFGVLPERETVEEIRHPEWQSAVDACRLLTSPVYHLLRKWHDLPELPYLGDDILHVRDDPSLAYV